MSETQHEPPHVTVEHRGLARSFYGLALAILLGFILYIGRNVIIPLVIATFLSFLIVTLKNGIERTPLLGRLLPEFISYILSFVLIVLVLVTLGQIITANAGAIIKAGPEYQDRLVDILNRVRGFLDGLPFITDWLNTNIPQEAGENGEAASINYDAFFDQFQGQILGFISSIASEIGASIRSLAQNLVTILLYTSFMMIERGNLLRKMSIVNSRNEDRLDVYEIARDIAALVRQYISLKTLTGLMTAGFSFIIMMLLGIDFAGFWALLIFALGYIPIIGAISGVMLPSVLALVQPDGGGLTLFLLTIGLLTAAEQTVSSVIEPRLMGRSLNLSPLVILLSLTIWGTLWGFAGMLLCVPITVTLMIVFSQFEETRPVAVMLSDNGEISPIKRLAEEQAAEEMPADTTENGQS